MKKIFLLVFLVALASGFVPSADARPICIGPINGGPVETCVLDAVTVEPTTSPTPSPTPEPNCGENGQPGKCPEGLVCQPIGFDITQGYHCEDPFPTPGPGCPGGCPSGQWCVSDHCENIPPCPAACPSNCEWNGVAMVCGDGGCSPACAAGYSCQNGGCVRDCTCTYGCNPDGSCMPRPVVCPGDPGCPPIGDEDDPCYDACYDEPVIQEVCDACRAQQGARGASAISRSSQQGGLLGALNAIVSGIAPLGQAVKQIVTTVLGGGAEEKKSASPAAAPERAPTQAITAPIQPAPAVASPLEAPAYAAQVTQGEEVYAGKACSSNSDCASSCSGGFCWVCQPLAQAPTGYNGICIRVSGTLQTPVPPAAQQPASSIKIFVPAPSKPSAAPAQAAQQTRPAAAPAPQPASILNQLICGLLTFGGLLGSCGA